MAKYSLFKVIYTNWGKDISMYYLCCCTLTMVWSKNVSSSTCIYSAFHCLCLSAIPMKIRNISLFLLLPALGTSCSFYRPHLTWQGYTGEYTPVHSLSCKYALKKVSTRWQEDREDSGKPRAPAVLLSQNSQYSIEHAAIQDCTYETVKIFIDSVVESGVVDQVSLVSMWLNVSGLFVPKCPDWLCGT